MQAPAIKATAFQAVVDDLQRLLDDGRLSRERLETSLEAHDLALLDEKQSPTAWIPIDTYERAVELLARVEAPGDREAYLVSRGERSAERLARPAPCSIGRSYPCQHILHHGDLGADRRTNL